MEPALSQALATLIGAIATAVLMWASFNFGPNARRRNRDEEDE